MILFVNMSYVLLVLNVAAFAAVAVAAAVTAAAAASILLHMKSKWQTATRPALLEQ